MLSWLNDVETDEWIDEPLEGEIQNVKPAQGRRPATCTLVDEEGFSIPCSVFGHQLSRYTGKWVAISGKGIKKTEYNGVGQLTVGDKASIVVLGQGESEPEPTPTPARKRAARGRTGAPKAAPKATADDFTKKLRRWQAGMTHAYVAASQVSDKLVEHGFPALTKEQLQAVASSFFITLDRSGILEGPIAPIPVQEPPAPPPVEAVKEAPDMEWDEEEPDSEEVPF